MIARLSKPLFRAGIAGVIAVAVPASLLAPALPAAAANDPRFDQAVTALRSITTMRASFTQTD